VWIIKWQNMINIPKIVERGEIDTPNTQICEYFWLPHFSPSWPDFSYIALPKTKYSTYVAHSFFIEHIWLIVGL
jgi:hypothetical protein